MTAYEDMTREQAQAEVQEIGRELADPARTRALYTIIYELGLCYDRLHELGVEL